MTRWVVVGAGAAGCVVAALLSDDPANEVVLVEAGPDHGATPDPRDRGPFLTDRSRIRTDATVIRREGGAPTPYEQGLGLGGSSLVNGAIVVPDEGADDVGLPLEPPWAIGALGRAVLEASPDAAPLLLVRRDGARVTAADAHLRPVSGRSNLRIVTDTPVRRLLVDGRRVRGVVTQAGVELEADRVVLCGGAIQTPALLLRSGIDTPGVGVGVQDHPAFAIALDLRPSAVDPTAPAIAVSIERPGHQILVVDHVEGAPELGVLMVALTRVVSEGRITLPDPDGPPLVELRLLSAPEDLDRMTAAVLEALELVESAPIRAVADAVHVDDVGTPASAIAGDADRVRAWVVEHLTGYHHVSASCRLGVVTDPSGRVRGYDGLYLCDASVLPGVPGSNPYLTVVQLARRLAGGWLSGS